MEISSRCMHYRNTVDAWCFSCMKVLLEDLQLREDARHKATVQAMVDCFDMQTEEIRDELIEQTKTIVEYTDQIVHLEDQARLLRDELKAALDDQHYAQDEIFRLEGKVQTLEAALDDSLMVLREAKSGL